MSQIHFQLRLTSDAEIGSGLGNEILNDIIARDHLSRPVLRGSHLKGLLRAALKEIGDQRGWSTVLDELCFGRGGVDHDDGSSGLIQVVDTPVSAEAKVRAITRTKLTDLGVVSGTSLRTTEALAAGCSFEGHVTIAAGAPSAVDMAMRLALLSLEAVGGGRNRGSGSCVIEVIGEGRAPGVLLRLLDAEVGKGLEPLPRPCAPASIAAVRDEQAPVCLRLIFRAYAPVCCPETPVVGSNVIRSGIGIPASAVQGAILQRLASENVELATRTWKDPRTRAWPLLPAAPEGAREPIPLAVRVALSHRMSKLQNEAGGHEFKDAAIEPYDWRQVASGSPLKGSDGVLLREADGQVKLWRSGDLGRLVTAHAVHHDATGKGRRNLFTVEALAPVVFSSLLCLPPEAAARLVDSLQRDATMAIGKSRTVRGGGMVEATPVSLDEVLSGWHSTAFVVQSPAAIPDDWDTSSTRAEELLARLVRESGWGELAELAPVEGKVQVVTQASCGVRFGWNRHGLGEGVETSRRLRARRVFLPGTVFVLRAPPSRLGELLVRGLGLSDADRQQGFGAVLPHPGVASRRFVPAPAVSSLRSDGAGQLAVEWFERTTMAGRGPSPSQISAVAERIQGSSGREALGYLRAQREGRSKRIWERWDAVFESVQRAIETSPAQARKALRTWQDLAIIHREHEGH